MLERTTEEKKNTLGFKAHLINIYNAIRARFQAGLIGV